MKRTPLCGEAVEVRRADLAAVAADVAEAHIVGHDEDDIGALGGGRVCGCCAQRARGCGLQKVTAGNHSAILSCQYFFDYFAMHVGQAEVAALEFVGQLQVVDAEQVQNRGLQIVYVDRVARLRCSRSRPSRRS